jgi:hypothetical protein
MVCGLRYVNLRQLFIALVSLTVFLELGQSSALTRLFHPIAAQGLPALSFGLGRPCFSIIDFGADPTSMIPSDPAINAAITAAAASNVSAICAPPGNYLLDGTILLYTQQVATATPFSVSIYGAGTSLTTFKAKNAQTLFASCPDYSTSSYTPSVPLPPAATS